jgi:LacI family transcriptional regulator
VLRKRGYSFLIASSDEGPRFEKEEIRQLLARRVDALIVASTQPADKFLEQIQKAKTPYLLLDRKIAGANAPFIGIDDTRAGELATIHLMEAGCQRIACIAGKVTSTATGRLDGFRKALAAHRLNIPEAYVVFRSRTDNEAHITGYEAMKALLAVRPRPDGVFCFNDPVAMGAMQAILDAGLRIPADIAVMGCGNLWFAPMLRVPLSSIDQQCQRMGEKAAAMALDMIAGKAMHSKSLLLQPGVAARQSTLGNGAN